MAWLRYAGDVGTGFTHAERRRLRDMLAPLAKLDDSLLAQALRRIRLDPAQGLARLTAELQFIDLLTDQAIDIADAIYGSAT